MAEYTPNYGFRKLGPGESISDESYKFADADRDQIDALIHSLEAHHHSGAGAGAGAVDAPALALGATPGFVPAGTRVYYKAALVDERGFEAGASPEAFIDTPPAIDTPNAPALELDPLGGILLPGNYYYVLTAYYPLNTQETRSGTTAYLPIPSGSTNAVILHFPVGPVGAAGFNVYRQKPGSASYEYLVSVPITTSGFAPANYTDDGTVATDPNRRPPSVNATQSTNAVDVTLPSSALPLPSGWTWKLYRTYQPSSYSTSLLHHVVEETFEGSGIITSTYTDTGGATFQGEPLTQSQMRPEPPQVDLEADVSGRLPLGKVQAFPIVVTFATTGPVVTNTGINVWVCEYPVAKIIGVRATLGVGMSEGTQNLILDVNIDDGANPATYSTVFTNQANRPKVIVGSQIGARAVPDIVDLVVGNSLSVDVDQVGTGAANLTINIVLLVQFDNAVSDWSWS